MPTSTREFDVIVAGAGVAGLSAARKIAESGLSTLVLEARNRVGGRIFTAHRSGEVVELGAEFVHGKPPELWKVLKEAKLDTYELEGTDACVEGGKLRRCGDLGRDGASILDKLENWKGEDISFAEFLARHPMPDAARQRIIGYVEGFNAADHTVIGVASLGRQQAAEESIEGDRAFRIRGGYSLLPQFLAQKVRDAGGEIILGATVRHIEWQHRRITMECTSAESSSTYVARQAVIALPLGVLQSGAVHFTPVPQAVHEAARLRMGNARRLTLIFHEKFWADLPQHPFADLSFLFSPASMPPVWWTAHPAQSCTLTGWVGGPRSQALAKLTEAELEEKACEELAAIFSLKSASIRSLLIRCSTHSWQDDPFSLGAYSYVPAGAIDASSKMTIPAEDTLFFAGEHTDTTGHWGTVHAALRSGDRAASQVLEAQRADSM
ncbi:MAG: NAD(P)/FAD-dependent oxidoreductase [Acidobacteriaceae bacterium]